MVVPLVIIHVNRAFSLIDHPALGVPPFVETPMETPIYCYIKLSIDKQVKLLKNSSHVEIVFNTLDQQVQQVRPTPVDQNQRLDDSITKPY